MRPHADNFISSRVYKEAGGLQQITHWQASAHHGVTSAGLRLECREQIRSTEQDRLFHMNDFGRLVEAEIPRLRRYARALTRDAVRADDLVQSCLARAVAKQHLWEYGTDLRAWLFTIMHNQHVNDVRRGVREGITVELTEAPAMTAGPVAIAKLELRDLEHALEKLPTEQREAILLVGLEGLAYEEVAAILKVPVGTVRSRLSRGRDQLRRLMGMPEKLRDGEREHLHAA